MATHQSIIAREKMKGMHTNANSSMVASSQQSSSSYSSNINKASSSSSTTARYNVDDSRNYARGEDSSRYYGEEGHQQRQGDEMDRDLEIQSIPDNSYSPASEQPPAQAAPRQLTQQTKPASTSRKGNVRIVGGKLFHVPDDVEGPISIQYIGDHPDLGPRGYHVASSTSLPVGKPRHGTAADGTRMHFIA